MRVSCGRFLVFLAVCGAVVGQTRVPLALTRSEYALSAGGTVPVEMNDASRAIAQRGRALRSYTVPAGEHVPFATADTDGRLVIATPSLAAPGDYAVSFDFSVDGVVQSGAV